MIVRQRAGLLKKPLEFTLTKELREIAKARQDIRIKSLKAKPFDYKQAINNRHSDEYKIRAEDLSYEDIPAHYNPDTQVGRERIKKYEALREKTFKSFDRKTDEIIVENMQNGHILHSINEY